MRLQFDERAVEAEIVHAPSVTRLDHRTGTELGKQRRLRGVLFTQAIIDRGAGKVRDHSNEQDKAWIDISALSPDERRLMAELLMKVMGREADGEARRD